MDQIEAYAKSLDLMFRALEVTHSPRTFILGCQQIGFPHPADCDCQDCLDATDGNAKE